MQNRTKIILVTGFLGAGKTTLLNRLIDNYRSTKIGIIINDFGKIAIDGILIGDKLGKGSENRIYEISNGSIFCSCLSAELVKSLKLFIDNKLEILIIETSGLSDPTTFEKILLDNNLDKYFKIQDSICIVDSTNILKLSTKIMAIERQISSSNIVLINKSDLIDEEQYYKISELIGAINKNSIVIKSLQSNFNFDLLDQNTTNESVGGFLSCNTETNRPGSLLLEQKELNLNQLEKFFDSIMQYILRLKGFLKVGENTYYISDSNGQIIFKKVTFDRIIKYGLSVLLPKSKESVVRNEWNIL